MAENTAYKYFAFISYSSKDIAWGKRLQRRLEGYRMPATLCSEHGWDRNPIKPVFFAPTDIQPGELSEELKQRLQCSKNLIVICSPNSAQSEWVGKEIKYFYELGRSKNIHFFIVDGEPHSSNKERECINPIVEALGMPEILGVNIHEKIYSSARLNRERAYVQLITKLLGIEFDSIWQRHRRLMMRSIMLWCIGSILTLLLMCMVWIANKPVDISMQVQESEQSYNAALPPMENAVVTLLLDNEVKIDTVKGADDVIMFANVPHSFLDEKVKVSIECNNFIRLDTTVYLSQNMNFSLQRDLSVYGDISFRIWSPKKGSVLPGVKVIIEGNEAVSDKDGWVMLQIPLSKQKTEYKVSASVPLCNDMIIMPCGDGDIILVKE